MGRGVIEREGESYGERGDREGRRDCVLRGRGGGGVCGKRGDREGGDRGVTYRKTEGDRK